MLLYIFCFNFLSVFSKYLSGIEGVSLNSGFTVTTVTESREKHICSLCRFADLIALKLYDSSEVIIFPCLIHKIVEDLRRRSQAR